MPFPPVPSGDLKASTRWINTPTTLAASTASNRVQLARGLYRFVSTGAVYIRQGGATVTSSSSTGFICGSYSLYEIFISETAVDDYVAAITGTGTATLYFQRRE